MIIRIRRKSDVLPSEVTDQAIYLNRRRFMQGSAVAACATLLGGVVSGGPARAADKRFAEVPKNTQYSTDEPLTEYDDVTSYNNFYEFDTDKRTVKRLAAGFQARPWTLKVEGEVNRPQELDVDELIRRFPPEERIYRFRCVEAWSMVIPWVGIPLARLIKALDPTGNARFVEFTTLYDPERFPGQKRRVLDWPYVEGLRMDEAVHPLTILAVGLYGELLPNQNGAPLRLVVPWKYGFKSIKSIVRMRFVERQPANSWHVEAPNEYGFYANVNPHVDHPRWSQARERRIGEFLKRKTLMFNGYEEEVADLYRGMDLRKYF